MGRDTRRNAQMIRFQMQAQQGFDGQPVHPARRAGVPGPAAPAGVRRCAVDIRAHDVRLDFVAFDLLRLTAVIDGIEHGEQFPRAFLVAHHGKRRRGPDRGMGILAAVLAHAGHVAFDIAGFKIGFVEGRVEQLDQLRIAPHQVFVYRRHRLAGAHGIAAAGNDRPALADRIDLAFVIVGRAQGGAVIEIGPPIPVAVPGMGLDVGAQL